MPLAIVLSNLEVTFYNIRPDVSHSVTYATNTAKLFLLFLVGIAVFYTGEALHRDREVRIESVIWSTPVPNSVLLLSKFLATVVLTVLLVIVVGLVAIVIQLVRGHTARRIFGLLNGLRRGARARYFLCDGTRWCF
jgi:ABC-type transport system involved in multi-copper enzyme maturation permease subunit